MAIRTEIMSYTPEIMKQVILDALSPTTNRKDGSSPERNIPMSPRGDGSELPLTPARFTSLPMLASSSPPEDHSSSPARLIDSDEYIPLLRNPLERSHGLGLHASPLHQPATPSPLRHVVSQNDLSPKECSNRLQIQSRVTSSSPIYALHTPVDASGAPYSSPIRTSNTSAETFEIDASFLHAMVGLFERQANIVPEHLFTKTDVEMIVHEELEKQRVEELLFTKHKAHASSILTPSKFSMAFIGGFSMGFCWHASQAYPEEVYSYLNGGWKGGLCGLAGAIILKGVLWAIDRLRNT